MNDMTPQTGTALAIVLPSSTDLAVMLKTENGLDATLASLKAAAEAKIKGADVSTIKGRELMKSAAYDVSKSKTEIVKRGKELTEQARKEVSAVNAGIKTAETYLDILRDNIKAPALKWEADEQARKDRIAAALDALRNHGMSASDPSAELAAKILEIDAIVIGEDFSDQREQAEMVRETSTRELRNLLAAAEKAEQDARELEELRAEKARRDAEEAERLRVEQERIAAEEAEKARIEAAARAKAEANIALENRATNARAYIKQIGAGLIGGQPQPFGILLYELKIKLPPLVDELGDHAADLHDLRKATVAALEAQAEAQRIEREATEAQERKAAEEKAAAEAKERAQREKAELEAAHKREVEEAAQRERDRLAAEAQAESDARAKREADEAHRARIKADIAAALATMKGAASPEQIAEALMAGKIPHCEVKI